MIARIHGLLEQIENSAALLRCEGGLTYEVLLPAYTAARLVDRIDQPVMLHTFHFIEATAQGANMTPRLAGFASLTDRQFFELFTTCKGIGSRKALRAMALSTDQIATAITDRDIAMLTSLPEIGRRTAETIVATLRDKVGHFTAAATYPPQNEVAVTDDGETPAVPTGMAREALEVLLQLGEHRLHAVQWIDQALSADDRPNDVEGIVAAAFRIKAGS